METKRKTLLGSVILMSLLMTGNYSYASAGSMFANYVKDEVNSMNGLYIILSVIGAGVIAKILHALFVKEEKPIHRMRIEHVHHRQRIIKKTS